MKSFLLNWKTSLVGLVGGVLVAVSQAPNLEHGSAKEWALALGQAVGVVVLGLFAKDADVTGVK